MGAFRRNSKQKVFPNTWRKIVAAQPPDTPIEVWFQDEMRVGQKNSLVRQWAPKGSAPAPGQGPTDALRRISSAPSAPSAVRARRWSCRAPILKPWTCISRKSAGPLPQDAHAVVLLDQAAWHTTAKLGIPENISLVPLPPKSPELNPAENVWQYLRQNWLSNRVVDSYEAIVEASCQAWNNLHRPTLEDHVHRPQSVGSHKSMLRAVDINTRPRI